MKQAGHDNADGSVPTLDYSHPPALRAGPRDERAYKKGIVLGLLSTPVAACASWLMFFVYRSAAQHPEVLIVLIVAGLLLTWAGVNYIRRVGRVAPDF